MSANLYNVDRTIVELFRDGGMDYETAVKFLDEHVTERDRRALCSALEEWEVSYREKQDRIDADVAACQLQWRRWNNEQIAKSAPVHCDECGGDVSRTCQCQPESVAS